MYQLKRLTGNHFQEINSILDMEMGTMNDSIILIGSANFPFPSVMDVLQYPFQYNPAEGTVNQRYFPKCESIDMLENYGSKLLKNLLHDDLDEFSATFQPYSGTQANQIVYNGILNSNDTVLSMSSKSGGHVSHVNYLNKFFNLKHYELDLNNMIDYDQIEKICHYENPKLLIAGASSYPIEIDYSKLGEICKKYGIYLLADISHTFTYISSGLQSNPIKSADFISFTTHKTTRGIRGGVLLYKNEYAQMINKSIFPLTQGAPKYNEVAAKVTMLVELSNMDLEDYSSRAIWFANQCIQFFKEKGIPCTTEFSDTHYVVLDLSKTEITGKIAEEKLASINILANRNMIPRDKRTSLTTSGLRIGFLVLTTINFSDNDFYTLLQIIYDKLFTDKHVDVEQVKNMMFKYNICDFS